MPASIRDGLEGWALRLLAGGLLPARWFEPRLPPPAARTARTGDLSVEVVSHCWNYAHLLVYQLSSLVLHPPRSTVVTMTVFHSPEDGRTVELLDWFAGHEVPRVRWNWRALPRERLFRRAIGRNLAARGSTADWVWFTDCDVVFHDGCLDGLGAQLQGVREALVHPRAECVTPLLDEGDPLLTAGAAAPRLLDIDPAGFARKPLGRATGPMQITHGDVARAVGYCAPLRHYQAPSTTWCKAHEDRAFRWLLQSPGAAFDIPGVYRIRHAAKGRYTGSRWSNTLRRWLRTRQEGRRR